MALDAASLSAFCSSPLSFSRLAWKLSARRKAMGIIVQKPDDAMVMAWSLADDTRRQGRCAVVNSTQVAIGVVIKA